MTTTYRSIATVAAEINDITVRLNDYTRQQWLSDTDLQVVRALRNLRRALLAERDAYLATNAAEQATIVQAEAE